MNASLENSPMPAVRKDAPGILPQFCSTSEAKKNILVVDDDSQIRESLRKMLRAEGYEVELAADGDEAIHKFNTGRIHLVLLDLSLPVNSGWDTFGTLTAIDPLIPIIIVTGRQNQSELAAAAGISALMEKPLNVPMLVQTIADLLAEDPVTRLKRLVGLRSDLRYAPPSHPISPDAMQTGQPRQRIKSGSGRVPSKSARDARTNSGSI